MFLSTDKNSRVISEKCCVVFDPSDGAIHHIHSVVNMEGAEEPEHTIKQRTLELAKEFGVAVEQMQILHVEPSSFEHNKLYAVDVSKRCLMVVEQPID
ncbi:hypothetical protein [Bacillus sp. 123MFChir2]|uniref:hypothetical protein n=1 Tax=Bacillus sp. 123MFChir2 TaxID=1169144 RepID=UPI000377B4B7|nr:hypothetical protein [Bacillus sp. 123MFChir2]